MRVWTILCPSCRRFDAVQVAIESDRCVGLTFDCGCRLGLGDQAWIIGRARELDRRRARAERAPRRCSVCFGEDGEHNWEVHVAEMGANYGDN